MSLCSRAQRPTGTGSSAREVCRRSVMVARAVEALGLEGMKKTLWLVSVWRICGGEMYGWMGLGGIPGDRHYGDV